MLWLQDERSLEQRQPDHSFDKYLQSVRDKVGVPQEAAATGIDTVAGVVHDTVTAAAQDVGDAVGGAFPQVCVRCARGGPDSHGPGFRVPGSPGLGADQL